MGGEFQSTTTRAERKNLQDKYAKIVERALWDYGHSGYSGSFAEKPELEIIPGVWTEEEAEKDCSNRNDKWGPAWAYKLHEIGEWYIGGWCSS